MLPEESVNVHLTMLQGYSTIGLMQNYIYASIFP